MMIKRYLKIVWSSCIVTTFAFGRMLACTFSLINMLLSFTAWSQDAKYITQKIDSIANLYDPDKPGAQLSVLLNGQLIYSKAWGLAELEHRVTLTTGTLIEAGSVSKQFTAAAILLLEKQGKLSLNDHVSEYFPAFGMYRHPILIRHLIHHTSGIREWSDVAELGGWPNTLRIMSNQEVATIIGRQKKLNSIPGERFQYSNSNYILLALIVEKVSGLSLAAFTDQFIFKPAGMQHTQWRTNYQKVVSARSQAYDVKNGNFQLAMPENNIHGSGGLLTTAEDLTKWSGFYLSGKLGGESMFTRQTGLDTLNNGDLNQYAAGMFVSGGSTKRIFQHGGATAGYRAKLVSLPDAGISVAWLSNTSMLDTTGKDLAMDVATLLASPSYFDSAPHTQIEAKPDFKPEELTAYVGLYKSSHSGRDVQIEMGTNGLEMSGNALRRIKKSQFDYYGILFSFEQANQLTIIPPSSEPMHYHLTDSAGSTIPHQVYLGHYYSDEVKASIIIKSVNKKLIAQFVSGDECDLTNHFKDGFISSCDLKADFFFKRDKHGKVTNLDVSTQRALHINFIKQAGSYRPLGGQTSE
ncbi:serine hydrolase domain-containing protein [Dyadobacter sediminis]|nr:serine hydrolase domain-containing protein [Dyadobacter sediminis]